MSTDAPPFDYENDTKYIRSIEYVEDGAYRIRVKSKSGEILETIGRLSSDAKDNINFVNFDSEEFGRQIMKGFIDSRLICQSISAFDRACKPLTTRKLE